MAHGANFKETGDAKLVAFVIHCDVCKKDVKVVKTASDWDQVESTAQECELCGDHGYVGLVLKCRCGKEHRILIKDW